MKLPPCPFCGSPALDDSTVGGDEWVSCSDEKCKAYELEMTRSEWSRRYTPPMICYSPCKAHEGVTFTMEFTGSAYSSIAVCPICNPPKLK